MVSTQSPDILKVQMFAGQHNVRSPREEFEAYFKYNSLLQYLKKCMHKMPSEAKMRKKIQNTRGFAKQDMVITPSPGTENDHIQMMNTGQILIYLHHGIQISTLTVPDDLSETIADVVESGRMQFPVRHGIKTFYIVVSRKQGLVEIAVQEADIVDSVTEIYFDEASKLYVGLMSLTHLAQNSTGRSVEVPWSAIEEST